jgi:hypothetical protein
MDTSPRYKPVFFQSARPHEAAIVGTQMEKDASGNSAVELSRLFE